MRRTGWIMCCFALSVAVSCGKNVGGDNESPPSKMTQSQRDSALAASKIPGAKAVGRALTVADSARARADRLNRVDP